MVLLYNCNSYIVGCADLFYKMSNTQQDKYSHLKTIFIVGIALFIVGLVELHKVGFNYDYSKIIVYFPVTIMYISSMAIGYFGLKYLEVSVSSPIQNSSGVGAALLSFLILGKTMEFQEAVLVGLLSLGILVLGILEKNQDKELQETIKKHTDKNTSQAKLR